MMTTTMKVFFILLIICEITQAGDSITAPLGLNDFGVPGKFYEAADERLLGVASSQQRQALFLLTNRRLVKLEESSLKPQAELTLCSSLTPFCPKEEDNSAAFVALNQDQHVVACSKVSSGDVNCSMAQIDDFTKTTTSRLLENSQSTAISSLVGVLAPLRMGHQALYVALGVKRGQVDTSLPPAISIRSARSESSFLITKPSMSLYYRSGEYAQRDSQYIGALSNNGFTYFFSISRRFNDQAVSLVSTIGRICQNDTEFRSYVETEFYCKSDDTSYDTLVSFYPQFVESAAGQQLIVAMATSRLRNTKKYSTVCALDWVDLNAHLDATVRRCVLDGSGTFGLENLRRYGDSQLKLTSTNRCTKPQRSGGSALISEKDSAELLCGKYSSELNSPLRASSAFSATTIIAGDGSDTEIAAVAADNRGRSDGSEIIRLFVLWRNGELQKFEILPSLSTRHQTAPSTIARKLLGDMTTVAENVASNVKMFFQSTHDHIFVFGASKRRLYQLPTANCGASSSSPLTCNSCLQLTTDSDCGWCYSSSACSTHSQCAGGKWLPKRGDSNRCVELAKVVHPDIPVGQSGVQIQLHVQGGSANLRRLQLGNFLCRFESLNNVETRGDETAFGVRCASPFHQQNEEDSSVENQLPPGVQPIDNVLRSRLSLLAIDASNNSRIPFILLQANVNFYNCSSFSNCSSCSSAPYACQWCASSGSCQDFDRAACPAQSTIVSEHIPLPSVTGPIGPSYCPTIQPSKRTMLVPAFLAHHLTVQVENFHLFGASLNSTKLHCLVSYDNKKIKLPANYVQSKKAVTCDVHEFNVTKAEVLGELSLSFNDSTSGLNFIEPAQIPIQLFACELLSNDCSTCLSLQAQPRLAEYHCRWCGNQCTFSARCPLAADSRCTNVRITQVTPLMAPTEGLTTFTITGENLGYSFEQIRYGVRVASIPCTPIQELYEVSRKIVCTLEASPNDAEISGPVEISFSDSNQRTLSQETVRIVRPVVTGFEPSRGPAAGGSLITISGVNLLIGNNVTVHIGNGGRHCTIIPEQSTSTYLRCLTTPGEAGLEAPLLVAYDNRVFIHGGKMYRYTQDPVVTHISPLTTFTSGGRHIYVHGKNFLSIQAPRIGVKLPSEKDSWENCSALSDFMLLCRSPPFPDSDHFNLLNLQLSAGSQPIATGQLMFEMDNVKTVRSMQQFYRKVASQIDYYPDPLFFKFSPSDQTKLQIGNSLVLEGENLNLAAGENDVEVHIGDKIRCNVTAISAKQLVCTLEEQQMQPFEQYQVRVSVGFLNFSIGLLQRFSPPTADSAIFAGLNLEALMGCAVGIIALLISGTVFCCFLARRSRQARRNYEKVRLQLDSLESNVRTECKIAFAELQTEMGLVTGLTGSGQGSNSGFSEQMCPPPIRDFDSYLLNFLFPSMPEHPCRVLAQEHEQLDRGLEHFDLLLSNKQFLGIFIRVLEDQKSFGVRDRVNVASLLCLAFVNRPEYLTDITLTLVGELATKSAEKKHPKLMLRRTESVAERLLSNWLSIVLYQWVSNKLSGPLFTLYRALKHQLEKGPIDAITYEAKYSLSEEKLLKENVAYKILNVNVRICFDHIRQPYMVQCRLLSCDSIGQAKSKIIDLLTHSVSDSPFWGLKVDDIDLIWALNDDENIILTETDNGENSQQPRHGFLSASGTLGKNSASLKANNADCLVVHLNTLQTYGITEASTLIVVHKLTSHHAMLTSADTHSSGGVSTTSSGVGESSSHRSPTSPRLSSAAALLGSLTMSRNIHQHHHHQQADEAACRFVIPPANEAKQSTTAIGSLRRYCSLRLGGTNKSQGINAPQGNNRWDGKARQDSFTAATQLRPQRVRYVHLVQSADFRSQHNITSPSSNNEQQTSCRNIPEIYLTRLLTTKGTLQKYVDDLFAAIFDTNDCPAAVRYLYTRLDDLAVKLGPAAGGDPAEVAYTWKCNSLPLRFLVNLLKNPDFVLDVEKPPAVDSSLSVLGQLLMDSCSIAEYRLGKDSPTNKLLFAREISRYRSMVQSFMTNAQHTPCYDQAEALRDFASLGISTGSTSQLSRRSAVLELYKYSVRYHMEILEALESQISTRCFVNNLSQQAYSPSQRSQESSSPSTASSNLKPGGYF